MNKNKNQKIIFSLVLAIIFHVIILWLFGFIFSQKHKNTKNTKTKYTVIQLYKNEQKKKQKNNSKHLSATDNKVKKETINRKQISKINGTLVKRSKQKTSKNKKHHIHYKYSKQNKINKKKQNKNKLQKVIQNKNINTNKTLISKTDLHAKSAKQPTTKLNLILDQKEISKVLGIRNRKEILTEIASGKQTMLNSRKWVGASFFLRVKEAISQVWNPGRVYKIHDPHGEFYGFKNWFTSLRITLDSKGNLIRVYILQPSGLRFLDLEAVRAVKTAAPFLNPPKEIVNHRTGKFSFRFGFIVEVNESLNFKMFRY